MKMMSCYSTLGRVYFYGSEEVKNPIIKLKVFFNVQKHLDSNKTEVKDAERIAHDYLNTDPSHRDPDTPIIKTKQMHEPIHFIGFFGPWDRNYWTVKNIIIFPIVFFYSIDCVFFSVEIIL
jgi:hypothetical protein